MRDEDDAPKSETCERRRQAWVGRFASANPVVLVSWIGALAYFVTRSAQTSFYSKFGVEPEDIGLGYAETLSRAAVGLLLLMIVAALTVTMIAFLVWLGEPKDSDGDHRESEPLRIGPFRWSVFDFLFFTLIFLAVWMPSAYTRDAHSVKDGNGLHPAGISSPRRLARNPLGLRVEPVRVSWIDVKQAVYDFGGRQVMYLGRASGTAVFFDPNRDRTVRVPESAIVIERTS